jgi:alkanesulfonate monooxygenase SsuD/methylene tetrahydromethanopterin reductase-like flavin-dependent oxidoreductase (luciferase family)
VADLVRFAVEAERAGIDGVMVSEHIVLGPSADEAGRPDNPRDYALPGNQDPASPWPSPLVLLSAVAAATSRVRLVAGALISPLRHPLVTAKDLATLDRLSGGRLIVQPTVSWHRDEYDALGVPFGRRGDILDEQLEIWAKAWSGSPVAHQGNHCSFGKIWVEPQPARPGGPALWFGGSSLHSRPPRAVIITGGGTGIGAAVARMLTAGGDRVAIFGRRPDVLRAVAARTGALDVVCDVSDAGQVAASVGSVAGRFGRLDGLVLNAGVMRPGGVADLSAADWDAMLAVNLTGAFHVAKAAVRRRVLRQRSGHPGGRVGVRSGRRDPAVRPADRRPPAMTPPL